MPGHKFRVGQLVNYHPSRGLDAPRGVYTNLSAIIFVAVIAVAERKWCFLRTPLLRLVHRLGGGRDATAAFMPVRPRGNSARTELGKSTPAGIPPLVVLIFHPT